MTGHLGTDLPSAGHLANSEHPAVIALGSNQGERENLLRDAVRALDAVEGVRVVAESTIIETPALKPHGIDHDAPSYLNGVVLVRTTLGPEELLTQLQAIEAEFGRVRKEVWGDRTLDLDLIDFDGIVHATDTITVPHPRAWERTFVLAPWLEVQPDAVIPERGPVAELLAAALSDAHTELHTGAHAESQAGEGS